MDSRLNPFKRLIYLFRTPGNRIVVGAYLTLANVLVSVTLILTIYAAGEKYGSMDLLDAFFEFSSVVIALLMFAAISSIKININIKAPFLLGLFGMQVGRTIDGLDEIVYFDVAHWSALGDGLAFAGEVLVVFAATRWMLHAYRLSMTDKLTRLYNRHFLDRAFEKALMFRRKGDSTGIHLIMLDIDDFKRVNDCYGHAVGDDVLKRLAEILLENTRTTDIVARQGGEEFEVLLTDGDHGQALNVAERIRNAIEKSSHANQPSVTASLGIAEFTTGDDIKSLRRRADLAVYEAKLNGKNRVVCSKNNFDPKSVVERLLMRDGASS